MTTSVFHQRVREVMTHHVVTVYPQDTVHEALELMVENRVMALPVLDNRGHVVGVISTSDLIDLTRDLDADLEQLAESTTGNRSWLIDKLSHSMGHERVDSVMSEDVASVNQEATLGEASRIMLKNRVHRLPVVDADGKLQGIVSTMDLLASFAENATE